MDTFEFDGKKYMLASKHQKEWGYDLISEISLKGNEYVLDLGCGDGILTEQLSTLVPYGTVLGIDASIDMIKTAQMIQKTRHRRLFRILGIHKSNLRFEHLNINEMHFENQFDLIFSNAALHWVKDHKHLLENAYKALKTDGIILWDFGSFGNCSNFIDVVQKIQAENLYAKYFQKFEWPWYMPSREQYTKLISAAGFSVYTIKVLNKDRYFSNASEMIQWIDQPCIVPFIKHIPGGSKESFRQEIIDEMLKRTQQSDGTYFETFRRIRVYAQKTTSSQE